MRRILSTVFLFAAIAVAPAFAGIGELGLDRAAVRDLIAADWPATLHVELPRLGRITLETLPPTQLDFEDGEVVAVIALRVPELNVQTRLYVRYAPEVDRRYGTFRLAARRARTPALPVDLAPFLPAVELPRRFDWSLDIDAQRSVDVVGFIQSVRIEDDRVHLELSLTAR